MKVVHGWKYVKNDIHNIYEVDEKDELTKWWEFHNIDEFTFMIKKSPPSTMDDDEWKSLTSNHGLCEALHS
jgi:hypothetical protein